MSLLGVPEPQRRMVLRAAGRLPGFLRDCIDHVMSVALLRENYFWSVYLERLLLARELPARTSQEESFAGSRRACVENVRDVHGHGDGVPGLGSREPFTAFVLLDHMDWLAAHPRLLEEEWAGSSARAAPGARVIFRSGGRTRPSCPSPSCAACASTTSGRGAAPPRPRGDLCLLPHRPLALAA